MLNQPKYKIAKENAIQKYEGARHLLNVTFLTVRDPKLLLGVVNNISSSLEYSIDAILDYERQLRLIPPYFDNFQSKFNLFRYKCVQRNKIPLSLVNLVSELREIIALHQTCPIEFQKGNRLVLCTKNYLIKTISITEIRKYLDQNKEFLDKMQSIVKS